MTVGLASPWPWSPFPLVKRQSSLRDVQTSERVSRSLAEVCSWVALPLRLPLPCLGLRRSGSDKFVVGKSPSHDTICNTIEAVTIVGFSAIVPECFFIKVAE